MANNRDYDQRRRRYESEENDEPYSPGPSERPRHGYGRGRYYDDPYRRGRRGRDYSEPHRHYDYSRHEYGPRTSEPYYRGGYGRDAEEPTGPMEPMHRRYYGGPRPWIEEEEEAEYRRRSYEMRRGTYAGRGPRGYQRSDERIREDINDRLTDDAYVDATDIEVSVNNSLVTLTGRVDSREEKRRAEDIADSVSGVTDVSNQLRVAQSMPITPDPDTEPPLRARTVGT
ncbi:MAG TPA: BON domain-containing protein [Blastocatellia bacterium]